MGKSLCHPFFLIAPVISNIVSHEENGMDCFYYSGNFFSSHFSRVSSKGGVFMLQARRDKDLSRQEVHLYKKWK